jgi:hypothetical protein
MQPLETAFRVIPTLHRCQILTIAALLLATISSSNCYEFSSSSDADVLEFRLRAVGEVLSWDNGKVEIGVRMEHRGVQAAGTQTL